jgi:hypothetical protein
VLVDIDDAMHSGSANPESSSARTTTTLGESEGVFHFNLTAFLCVFFWDLKNTTALSVIIIIIIIIRGFDKQQQQQQQDIHGCNRADRRVRRDTCR